MQNALEAEFQKHLASIPGVLQPEAIRVMRMSFMAGAMAAMHLPMKTPEKDRGVLVQEMARELVVFGMSLTAKH